MLYDSLNGSESFNSSNNPPPGVLYQTELRPTNPPEENNEHDIDRRASKQISRYSNHSRSTSLGGRRPFNLADTERSKLQAELEEIKKEKKEGGRERSHLLSFLRQLQVKSNSKATTPEKRNAWKLKYYEEKKETGPREDQVKYQRMELEDLNEGIIRTMESSKENVRRNETNKEDKEKRIDEINDLIHVTRLEQEIEDLQSRIQQTKARLTSETKLRIQSDHELQMLKAQREDYNSNGVSDNDPDSDHTSKPIHEDRTINYIITDSSGYSKDHEGHSSPRGDNQGHSRRSTSPQDNQKHSRRSDSLGKSGRSQSPGNHSPKRRGSTSSIDLHRAQGHQRNSHSDSHDIVKQRSRDTHQQQRSPIRLENRRGSSQVSGSQGGYNNNRHTNKRLTSHQSDSSEAAQEKQELEKAFKTFASKYGGTPNSSKKIGLASNTDITKWAKDARILGENLTLGDVDIAYARVKQRGGSKYLTLDEMPKLLDELEEKYSTDQGGNREMSRRMLVRKLGKARFKLHDVTDFDEADPTGRIAELAQYRGRDTVQHFENYRQEARKSRKNF